MPNLKTNFQNLKQKIQCSGRVLSKNFGFFKTCHLGVFRVANGKSDVNLLELKIADPIWRANFIMINKYIKKEDLFMFSYDDLEKICAMVPISTSLYLAHPPFSTSNKILSSYLHPAFLDNDAPFSLDFGRIALLASH